jgi:hypothetical protein
MTTSGTAGRRRGALAAVFVLLLICLLVSWTSCAETTEPDAPDDASPAAPRNPPQALPRARARTEPPPETPPAPPDARTAGSLAFVDGWPAADVVVRRPGGGPAPGAVVYLHPAGQGCGDRPLQDVARRSADNEGRVRFPVATAGRYDIGAFEGPGFSSLVTDVDLPAARPVEIVLPETARLDVRWDGEFAPNANVSITLASAARIAAFPGRREGKYAAVLPLPRAPQVEVPRGVPLHAFTHLAAVEPAEFVAPGAITIRAGWADGRVDVPVEFAFVGGEPPGRSYAVELTVEVPGSDMVRPYKHSVGTAAGRPPSPARLTFHAPPGPVELRLQVFGQPATTATVVAAPGVSHRVPVTVVSWEASDTQHRVRWTSPEPAAPESARVLIRGLRQAARRGEECAFTMSPPGPVAVVAEGADGAVFVSAPATPQHGTTLTLPVVAAAKVAVKMERPPSLDPSWTYTVERADGQPFVAGDWVRTTANPEEALTIVLPPGDVELVFRFAGRETGRRTVRVVAGPPIEVVAPEVTPAAR